MSNDRLRAVEQGQVRIETLLEEHVREQRDFNAKITKLIDGNGKPGLPVRLDRLEQDHQKRKRLGQVGAGALLVMALERAWAYISQ